MYSSNSLKPEFDKLDLAFLSRIVDLQDIDTKEGAT